MLSCCQASDGSGFSSLYPASHPYVHLEKQSDPAERKKSHQLQTNREKLAAAQREKKTLIPNQHNLDLKKIMETNRSCFNSNITILRIVFTTDNGFVSDARSAEHNFMHDGWFQIKMIRSDFQQQTKRCDLNAAKNEMWPTDPTRSKERWCWSEKRQVSEAKKFKVQGMKNIMQPDLYASQLRGSTKRLLYVEKLRRARTSVGWLQTPRQVNYSSITGLNYSNLQNKHVITLVWRETLQHIVNCCMPQWADSDTRTLSHRVIISDADALTNRTASNTWLDIK